MLMLRILSVVILMIIVVACARDEEPGVPHFGPEGPTIDELLQFLLEYRIEKKEEGPKDENKNEAARDEENVMDLRELLEALP